MLEAKQDPLFKIGARLCKAVGIDQRRAQRLTDSERLEIALEICRLAESGAKQSSAGRLGNAMAYGTAYEREQRTIAMQKHADQLAAKNSALSWREIAKRVGIIFELSGRRVRQLCDNPKAGKQASISRNAHGSMESQPTEVTNK